MYIRVAFIVIGIFVLFGGGGFNIQIQIISANKVDNDLKSFMMSFRNAKSDLQWIRETGRSQRYNDFDGNDEHINLIDQKWNYPRLQKNKKHVLLKNGDEWYENYRKFEDRCDKNSTDNQDNSISYTNLSNLTSEINLYPKIYETNIFPVISSTSKKSIKPNRYFHPSSNSKNLLQDQLEKSKNDLSHEANYKLSKFEQENEERYRKYKIKNFHLNEKRMLNPDAEIKLKINSNLMKKKFKKSQNQIYHEIQKKNDDIPMNYENQYFKKIPNYNLFKRNNNNYNSRNLLNIEEYNELQMQSDEEKFNEFGLPRLMVIEAHPKTNHHKKQKNLKHKINRVIVEHEHEQDYNHPDAHKKPKDFDCDDDAEYNDDERTTTTTTKTVASTTEKKIVIKTTKYPKAGDAKLNDTAQVKIKLEIDINNSSVTTKLNNREVKDILRRGKRHWNSRRLHRLNNKRNPLATSDQLNDLITGKLPNQLVKAVFQLVETNNNFNKKLKQSLAMEHFIEIKENATDLFKTPSSNSLLKNTEDMMKTMMESVNNLIEEQVQLRTCIQLKPDLENFLHEITKYQKHDSGHIELDKKSKIIQKRSNNDTLTIEQNELNEKYKTIRNLLILYQKLPLQDQIKIKDIKLFLEKHLIILDEIEMKINRSNDLHRIVGRDVKIFENVDDSDYDEKMQEDQEKNLSWNNDEIDPQISNRFIKLAKTAKFIRKNALNDVEQQSFDESEFDV